MATITTRLTFADNGRPMSLDDFREAESVPGWLYELARGVVEVVEVPGDDHWRIVDILHEALSDYRRSHPGLIDRIGHGSDIRVVVPEVGSDRHPDLAVVFPGASRDERGRPRPALVIEVVSPGSSARDRDLRQKRDDYRLAGIREYWIVDPEARRVVVLARQPEGDWAEQVARDERPIPSLVLPDFSCRPTDLWGD